MFPNRNNLSRQHTHTPSLIQALEETSQLPIDLSFRDSLAPKSNLLNTLSSLTQYKISKSKCIEHLALGKMILSFNNNAHKKHRPGHKRYKTQGKNIVGFSGQCQSGKTWLGKQEAQILNDKAQIDQRSVLEITNLEKCRQVKAVKMKIIPNTQNQQPNTSEIVRKQRLMQQNNETEQYKNEKIKFIKKSPSLNNRTPSDINNKIENQAIQQQTERQMKFIREKNHKKKSTKDSDHKNIKKFYVITEQSETSYQTGSKIIENQQFQSSQWEQQEGDEDKLNYCLKQRKSNKLLNFQTITSRYLSLDFNEIENKENQNSQQQKNRTVSKQRLQCNEEELQIRIGLPVSLKSSTKTKSLNGENFTKITYINNELDLGVKIIDDSFEMEVNQSQVYYDPWALINVQNYDNKTNCRYIRNKSSLQNGSSGEEVVLDQSLVSPQCQKLRGELQQVLNSQSLATTYQFYSPQMSYDYGGKTLKSKNTLQRPPFLQIPSTKSSTFYSQPITRRDRQLQIQIKNSVSQLTMFNDVGLVFSRTLYQINCQQKNLLQVQQFLKDLTMLQHPYIVRVYSLTYSESLQSTLNPSNNYLRCKKKSTILSVYKQAVLCSGVYQSVYSVHDMLHQKQIGTPKLNPRQFSKQFLQILSSVSKFQYNLKLDLQNLYLCFDCEYQQLKLDISNLLIQKIEQLLQNEHHKDHENSSLKYNVQLLESVVEQIYEELYRNQDKNKENVLFCDFYQRVQELMEVCEHGRRVQEIWIKIDCLALHPYLEFHRGSHQDQIDNEICTLIY